MERTMRVSRRLVTVAVLLIAGARPARGQAASDPSGHWQGSVDARGTEMTFAIDLARRADGQFDGTLAFAAQKINGLPLTKVSVEGRSVAFHARSDQPFTGLLSDDRLSIAGDFLISGTSLPFVLTRTGEAVIQPPPRSAALTKALEGTWTGTILAEGVEHHLVMTLENHRDGTGGGRIVNEDEGGLELPITIVQRGSSVTIETVPIASTFAATLNDTASELAGVVTQGPVTAPLSFRRAK
jgi:hypothetical protein